MYFVLLLYWSLSQFQAIFVSFVVIVSLQCCCFKAMSLVRNVPSQGLWCWLLNQGAAEYFLLFSHLNFSLVIFYFSRARQENKAKGLAFLRAGNRQQALECFQKCVDISPEMALEVIKVLLLLFVSFDCFCILDTVHIIMVFFS